MRLYADPDGESHFEDVAVTLTLVDVAPPAPPLSLSDFLPAAQVGFLSGPPDWRGDWHPALRRQFLIYLTGGTGVQASDGEVRHFRAGDVVLVEDTTGRGHRSWAEGQQEVVLLVVQVPD